MCTTILTRKRFFLDVDAAFIKAGGVTHRADIKRPTVLA